MVNNFNWCGFNEAMERRSKVLEVCNIKGWTFLCMQPGKRYVIKVGMRKYYWTYDEVLKEGGVANGTNSLDNLQVGGNNLLVDRISDKVSLVRYTRGI